MLARIIRLSHPGQTSRSTTTRNVTNSPTLSNSMANLCYTIKATALHSRTRAPNNSRACTTDPRRATKGFRLEVIMLAIKEGRHLLVAYVQGY